MPKHEIKQCLRCQADFECKSGSINLCQCSKIELSAEQLEYLSLKYDGCLCLDCLKILKNEFNTLSPLSN